LTGYIDRPPWPNASPAELAAELVHDRVLSGDIIVEQNIRDRHLQLGAPGASLKKVTATGGRQGRPPLTAIAIANYNAVFHYPNKVDVTFSSTQFARDGGTSASVSSHEGTAISPYTVPLGIWGQMSHGRPRSWWSNRDSKRPSL
jgi:hypothetical protein